MTKVEATVRDWSGFLGQAAARFEPQFSRFFIFKSTSTQPLQLQFLSCSDPSSKVTERDLESIARVITDPEYSFEEGMEIEGAVYAALTHRKDESFGGVTTTVIEGHRTPQQFFLRSLPNHTFIGISLFDERDDPSLLTNFLDSILLYLLSSSPPDDQP